MLRKTGESEFGISFAHVGSKEELAAAEAAADEIRQQTVAASRQLAEERNLHLPELLELTGDQLRDLAIELLLQEREEAD
jgi:hypothetical protein